jgi:hypothetical protein
MLVIIYYTVQLPAGNATGYKNIKEVSAIFEMYKN